MVKAELNDLVLFQKHNRLKTYFLTKYTSIVLPVLYLLKLMNVKLVHLSYPRIIRRLPCFFYGNWFWKVYNLVFDTNHRVLIVGYLETL